MERTAGRVGVRGAVAYVPQESWIFNDTLRNNILFGLPYDEERYRAAVEGARMTRDAHSVRESPAVGGEQAHTRGAGACAPSDAVRPIPKFGRRDVDRPIGKVGDRA